MRLQDFAIDSQRMTSGNGANLANGFPSGKHLSTDKWIGLTDAPLHLLSKDNSKATNGKMMPESSTGRKLRLGIVGIGVGASEILPAMEQMPEFELVAAADVNPRVLETFRQRYGAKTYDSVDKLCADPDVEAVWISTPNRFHAPHSIIAANAGKHVVVEKPMAISLQEAEQMIEASIKNKIKLLCGHTQSFGPHIRTMRKIIRSGELGPALRAARLGVHRLDAPAAHGGRTGHQPRRRRSLSPGTASNRYAAPARRRLGAQCARFDRTMVQRTADRRLLFGILGIRRRHAGDADAQWLRLFSRVRTCALGRPEQPLQRSRARGDPKVAVRRHA